MAANVLKNHNHNPYYVSKEKQQLILFTATDYYAGLLTIISPIALRVMLVLAGKLNAEGYATGTLEELAVDLRTQRTYVNKGILELAKRNMISKKKRGQYWIHPDVFRPATIEIT